MINSIIKTIIGDLDEKREYKQMMKRANELPEDYRFAFKKIQKYMFSTGIFNGDINVFIDLIELFEISMADGRNIIEVVGNDVDKFCNEFMSVYADNNQLQREKLNKEIMEKFNKEGKNDKAY